MNLNKKYVFLLLSFLSLTNLKLFAQLDSSIAKNTIYIEGLGNGIIGSVNYDRLFFFKKQKFSWRIGLFYLPLNIQPIYSVPIELNLIKGKKHNIEFGLGFTYGYAFNSSTIIIPQGSNFITKEEYSEAIYSNLKIIGYRFHKPSGGLFIKASGLLLFKIIELNKNYLQQKKEFIFGPYIGVSIGYTFKKKNL